MHMFYTSALAKQAGLSESVAFKRFWDCVLLHALLHHQCQQSNVTNEAALLRPHVLLTMQLYPDPAVTDSQS